MKRDASQTRSASTPCSSPSPVSASHSTSADDPVQRVGDRQHGRGDRLGAVAGGLDRHRQRVAAGALAVEADRHAGGLRSSFDDAGRTCPGRARRPGRAAARGRRPARPAGGPSRPPAARLRHVAGEGQAGVEAAARLAHGRGGRRPGSRRRSAGRAAGRSSMPLSAAQRMKRRTRSSDSGREPTRKRPRSAICSGVARAARLERRGSAPRGSRPPAGRRRRSSRRRSPRARRSRRCVEDLGHLEHARGRDACPPAAAGRAGGRWCRRCGSRP